VKHGPFHPTEPDEDPRRLPGLPRRFRILRLLGEGSQKKIYLADDTQLNRRVAISVVDPHGLRRVARERLHEVLALAQMREHRHIVATYEVIEDPAALYIIGQYLPGGDLEARLGALRSRVLPIAEALRIASDVCLALEHAHASGIAHCDVKPGNIFLDEDDTALLGDFGLAEITGAPPDGSDQILGTPAYLAPEQISRNERGPSCDLYALGCLLYELTTGRAPFVAASASEVLRLQQVARPTPPVDRNPAIPTVLSDLILKLLEKEPAARPSSARDVRAALSGIRNQVSPGTRTLNGRGEPELVARQREIAALARSLRRTRAGVPGLVLLAGDAGIGKSRLLDELRRMAEDHGCLVLFGQAFPEAPVPYRALADALMPLAGRLSELDPDGAEQLRDVLHMDARVPQIDPRQARERQHGLFAAVFAALATFSNPRPLVLAVDDLHWADSASLDLFEHLATALAQHAAKAGLELLLIGSYRPQHADHRLSRAIERIARETICERIELAPLDESGVFAAMSGLGIERPSGQLVHRVREVTGGNPLFIREVVDHLVRSGKLAQQRGFTVSSDPGSEIELPSSLTSAIADRTSRLSEGSREWITLASLLGMRFELERLVAIAAEPADRLIDALDEAVLLGVLLDEGHQYRFTHPLVQQVMSQLPSAQRRQQLHLRIAEHLEKLATPDRAAAELEIVFHLVRAGPLADPVRLTRYANRAAECALASFAWHEAAELLEAAIAIAGRAPEVSPLDVAELHRKAGLAYFRRYDSAPCLHHYDAAAEILRTTGDAIGLAHTLNDRTRVANWLGLISYGNPADVEPLERALESLGPDESGLRALILSTLADLLRGARQNTTAERAAAEALELARSAGDYRLCAEASLNLGLTSFLSLRIEEALSIWSEGREHARRASDLFSEERCLQRIVMAQLVNGRLEEAERNAREVQEMNRILQAPGDASLTSALLQGISLLRGDLAAAERHGQEALDLVRRAKYPWVTTMIVPALAFSRAIDGHAGPAHDAVALLADPEIMFADSAFFEPLARDLKNLVDCLRGDTDLLDRMPIVGRGGPDRGVDLAQLVDSCARVEFADALQRPELVDSAAPILEVAHQNGAWFTTGWPFFVPRLLGVVALLEGAPDHAVVRLERALAIAERAGARLEQARTTADLARALAVRDTIGDRILARGLLRRALPELRVRFPGAVLARAEKLSAFLEDDQH
jgi:tetratricopeptide (TPR) repeat protein